MTRQTSVKMPTAIHKIMCIIEENKKSLKPSTVKGYLDAAKIILKYYPDVCLKDATPNDISEFLNTKLCGVTIASGKVGYATKTRKHVHFILNMVFNHYCADRKLRSNPFREASISVVEFEQKKQIEPYTTDELIKLSSLRTGDGIVEKFLLDCCLGNRGSESTGAILSAVDLDKKTLQIGQSAVMGQVGAPKTFSSKRTIRLPDFAVKILAEQIVNSPLCSMSYELQGERRNEQFLFCNPKTKQIWQNSSAYYRALRYYFEKAGVTYRGCLPSRHTFVSRALDLDANREAVADHLGHVKRNGHSSTTSVLDAHYADWRKSLRGTYELQQLCNTDEVYNQVQFENNIVQLAKNKIKNLSKQL
ncbi:tyrosine-type recombinase/integrase [Vibrio breoganii]